MSRDERGMSESVGWAVLAPSLLLVILGALQLGLWWHASNMAQHAAAAGAQRAAVVRGSAGDARAAAMRVAESGDLQGVSVTVDLRAGSVRVSVTGSATTFVPGLGSVTAVVELPREPS